MADENYTIEVNTRIKGDLKEGLKDISTYSKKAAESADKMQKGFRKIDPKPIKDLQKASDQFGRSMAKLKPKALTDMSKSAAKLSENMNKIKPKGMQDLEKATTRVQRSFEKIKPKPFTAVGRAVDKIKTSFDKLKAKPFHEISSAANKVKASMNAIKDKPLKGLSASAERLKASLDKIKATPFKTLGTSIEKVNSRVLNFIKNVTLMGYNIQGIVLLAVNRLKAAFVELTDQLNRVIGQMEKWAGSAEDAKVLVDALQDISVDTGWDLDDLSSTFTKLGTAMEGMGLSTEQLIESTRGLGLLFRQVGDDGNRMAKVAGQLGQLFTRETPAFGDLQALLGRGRMEQVLRSLADELLRLKGIDLSDWANKGMSALAVLRREMDSGAVSGKDLMTAWMNLMRGANGLSVMATEIGHGFDKLTRAMAVFITTVDSATGFSNILAAVFSALAHAVKYLADNFSTLMKVGIIGTVSYMVLNLPKVYAWLVAIGTLIATWASKLKPLLAILAGIAASIATIKGAIGLLIGAMVLFGKEADEALEKYKDKMEKVSPILYGILKTITSSLAAIEKLLDKITSVEEKKDLGSLGGGNITKPPQTLGEAVTAGGAPSEIGKVKSPEQIAKEADAALKSKETVLSLLEGIQDRAESLRATLKLDAPGTDVRAIHEQMKNNYKDLLDINLNFGTVLSKNKDVYAKYLEVQEDVSRFRKGGKKIDPREFFTGLRGEIKQLTTETENLVKYKKILSPEDFDRRMKGLIQRRKDSLVRYGGETQLMGEIGKKPHATGTVRELIKLRTLQAPFEKKEMSPLVKAITELFDRQAKATRAVRRGDQTAEEHKREQQGIYGDVQGIRRKFTDELDVEMARGKGIREGREAKDQGFILDMIEVDASKFLDPIDTIFSGHIKQLENLETAYGNNRIGTEEYLESLDSLNRSVKSTAVANADAVEDSALLGVELRLLNQGTKAGVEWMKPLNKGVRALGVTFNNVNISAKAGYLEGKKLAESYVSINDNARQFRIANARQLQQNPLLLASINKIIETTDKWRKALQKVPPPKGVPGKIAQGLGFKVDPKASPGKQAEQLQQQQAATGMITQAAVGGVDRVFDEGTQGRDFGPAGDIAKDFTKNLITMGPALATLKAALDVIIEIFVQAADMANFFGQGLQAIFDPLNRLITLIAEALSPIFDMLGSVFETIGGIISAVVSILRPFLKLITAILKPFQAIFAIFRVLGQLFKQIGQAIGAVIMMALRPFIDALMWVANGIIDIINFFIKAYNKVMDWIGLGKGAHLDLVTLEGKRNIPEEEKEKAEKDKEKKDREKGLDISAKMLAALKRMNKVLEKEAAARAQSAREIVRVKEIGSITEARQRGVISQEQSAENAQPLMIRIVNVNDPREIAAAMATPEGERAVLNVNRRNSSELQEMMLR